MRKIITFGMIGFVSFIVSCTSESKYSDDDVAAIVRGDEITVGDIRFLYEVKDKEIRDKLPGIIKGELAIQEAKKLNIDVTEQVLEAIDLNGGYIPENDSSPGVKSTREFVDSQAKKLGMDPEEFYQEYIKITTEKSAYIVGYIETIIGDSLEDIEEYSNKAYQLLDDLVEGNKDQIEILID
ncbi:hypothetical protein [Bacillus sp. JJ1562]|uniref:hypothetical protein n=1 Tax=Bacillus sp. JJ1562 TaxID=3122960 RepID=UPI003001D447